MSRAVQGRAHFIKAEIGKEERLFGPDGSEATVVRNDDGDIEEVDGDVEPVEHFYPEFTSEVTE